METYVFAAFVIVTAVIATVFEFADMRKRRDRENAV